MLTRALILAAGKGIAVGDHSGPNCLATVGGVTLIERTLTVLEAIGIRQIAITTGWGGAELRAAIADSTRIAPSIERSITYFDNPHWDKPNGLSVQVARAFLTERTLLVMADQIAAPALLRELCALPSPPDRTVLCVDRDLARVFDIDDATKVQLAGDAVRAIGKDLRQYHAVSAGLFVMSPTLLGALDSLDEPSLTQGVAAAAARGLVGAHDVGTKLWQDVDSPAMKGHADWLLRVYGGDLASPSVPAAEHSHAGDTLALVDRLLAEKDLPGHVLFSPGPVMTSARVKAALVHHDVCHRDEDYSAVVGRLQSKLRPVFGASPEHEMLLLTGSGTAAMEMAISSAIPEGKKILVVSNGAFGDRLDEIAALHGIGRVVLRYPWGELPDPAAVARALASDADIAGAALIHHETSVGLLNPVREIGRLCHARGVTLIVDAVSALGAEDVDVVRDHVDICYSSANKCLHSVSGVSFLCVAPAVWPRIADIRPRVYYLDLQAPPPLPRGAAADAVHARGVVVLRARDRARRAGRERRRARAPRRLSRARVAHPPRLHRPRVRAVHAHRARVAHDLDAAAARLPDRRRALSRPEAARFRDLRLQGPAGRAPRPGREHGRDPATPRSTRSWRRSPKWSPPRVRQPRRARR